MIKVSIISSSYNEEENIPVLINAFNEFNKNNEYKYELIIIDDGSTDNTYSKAIEHAKNNDYIQITKHKKNLGKTEGIKTGFNISQGEIIVIYDTDMQYSLDDIKKLVNRIEKDDVDICTGWKQGNYKKAFVSNVYNFLSRKIFNLPIHDQNGLKALKRDVLSNIHLRKDWHRYIVSLAVNKGFTVAEEKVTLYPRKYGKSKYGNPFRVFIGIFDMITVKFILSFIKKPMLFFGGIGTIVLILGFILGIVSLILRAFYNLGFRPLLYLVMLLIIAGLILFTMGFLAELVAILYEEFQEFKNKKHN